MSGRNQRWQMQQGCFRATGMMNHHPQALRRYSVATLVTRQVGHFWKADPGQFSKAPKACILTDILRTGPTQPARKPVKSLSHFCRKYRQEGRFGRLIRFITTAPSTTCDSWHFLTRKRSLVRIQSCLPYLSVTYSRFYRFRPFHPGATGNNKRSQPIFTSTRHSQLLPLLVCKGQK